MLRAPARESLVSKRDDGFYELTLKGGDCAILTPVDLDEADLTIEPIPVSKANRNRFGLSDKTSRLPGHQHYYKK